MMKRCSGFLALRSYSTKARAPPLVSAVRRTAEELTGQNEVSLAQAEVREKREELKRWRQKVTDATNHHENIQQRLRHVYAIKTQLYQAQRRDLAALQAINTEEESLTSEEQSQTENLEKIKLQEKECFDSLGDAILSSHEKERAQSERVKHYSRLGSIIGALVGFAGSNLFLRREVRRHQRQVEEKMVEIEETLEKVLVSSAPEITEHLPRIDSNKLREVVEEANEKQLKELQAIHHGEISQLYTVRHDGYYDTQTFAVSSLGLFVVSYTLCAIVASVIRGGR